MSFCRDHLCLNHRLLAPLRAFLMVLLALVVSGCKDDLYTNLNEVQANEVVAALRESGIPASKSAGEEGKWIVQTDPGRFADAVAVLKAAGVPHEAGAGLNEMFKRQGLVSSPAEERARLIHALSEELSRTISQIDGVLVARVHVVLPTKDLGVEKPRPASASVFIKHRVNIDLSGQIPKIKAMVVNGIEGVSYETVSVALFPASGVSAPPATAIEGTSNRKMILGAWLLGGSLFGLIVAVVLWFALAGKFRSTSIKSVRG